MQVRAGDLSRTITQTKHSTNEFQAAPLRSLGNDKLLRFQVEDPISGTIHTASGKALSLTNGHHRSVEIINRVNSGKMSPDTIIRKLVHD